MPGAVGGSNVYPTLQSIADLFRVGINDTFNNAAGSGVGNGGGAGLIMPNTNPDLLTILNDSLQDLYTDLRNVGDPSLILDNYILSGLPPITPNPAVQVSIDYTGYFNGTTINSQWTLPATLVKTYKLWERATNANEDFLPMGLASSGLGGVVQGLRMRLWETRQGAIWMPGCTQTTDIRIRCRITVPDFINPQTINFSTTYVPLVNCRKAVVAKMKIIYADRFAPELKASAEVADEKYMGKLRLEVVRQLQSAESQRAEFGGEAVQDFAIAWAWL